MMRYIKAMNEQSCCLCRSEMARNCLIDCSESVSLVQEIVDIFNTRRRSFFSIQRDREREFIAPIYIYIEREKIHRLDREREREDSSPRQRERRFIAPTERGDSSHRVYKVGGSLPNLDYFIIETLMLKQKINTLTVHFEISINHS